MAALSCDSDRKRMAWQMSLNFSAGLVSKSSAAQGNPIAR